jgi:spore germination protein YaaH
LSRSLFQSSPNFQHFHEDTRAFMAKLELVKKYKLRGYSVWLLGDEDPALWRALPRP